MITARKALMWKIYPLTRLSQSSCFFFRLHTRNRRQWKFQFYAIKNRDCERRWGGDGGMKYCTAINHRLGKFSLAYFTAVVGDVFTWICYNSLLWPWTDPYSRRRHPPRCGEKISRGNLNDGSADAYNESEESRLPGKRGRRDCVRKDISAINFESIRLILSLAVACDNETLSLQSMASLERKTVEWVKLITVDVATWAVIYSGRKLKASVYGG